MGDRSLSRRLAASLNRLTFDADETAAGAFLVRETFTPGRAADGVRTDTALSTPPVRRGAGRLGFAVVAFDLVIENRHSKNLGHYINLPRGGARLPIAPSRAETFDHAPPIPPQGVAGRKNAV